MLVLAVLALVGTAVAEPQILTMGYSIVAPQPHPSILPYSYTSLHGAPIGAYMPASYPAGSMPASHSIIPMRQNIIYPSLDITMGRSSAEIPKPVEDTPEVKKAKMEFEMAYNKALMGIPESSSVFRAKRDVSRVLPYGYNLPYSGYVTPYGHYAQPVPSTSVIPSNMLQSPYYAHL